MFSLSLWYLEFMSLCIYRQVIIYDWHYLVLNSLKHDFENLPSGFIRFCMLSKSLELAIFLKLVVFNLVLDDMDKLLGLRVNVNELPHISIRVSLHFTLEII